MPVQVTPFAEVSCAGVRVRIPVGGILGRASHAALKITDPSVSEAHAWVSLRDAQLSLQALRGRMFIAAEEVHEVPLRPGLDIRLSETVQIRVERVVVPVLALMLVVADDPAMLPRLPCSLLPRALLDRSVPVVHAWDRLALIDGESMNASLVWHERAGVAVVQPAGGEPTLVEPPCEWTIDGELVRLVGVPLQSTAATAGRVDPRRDAPLRIIVRYDSVHIWSRDPAPTVLWGIPARIITELHLMGGGPVGWETVAREIWSDRTRDRLTLRANWDKALGRLRDHLRTHAIRKTLIGTNRHGLIELILHPGDEVVDQTGEAAP